MNDDGSTVDTFGTNGNGNGKQLIACGADAECGIYDAFVAADGRILLSGDGSPAGDPHVRPMLARLTSGGLADGSYGAGAGQLFLVGDPPDNEYAEQAAPLPGGAVAVLAGPSGTSRTTPNELSRVSADGVLDTSFGSGGFAAVDPTDALIDTVAADANGDLILAGHPANAPAGQLWVDRLTAPAPAAPAPPAIETIPPPPAPLAAVRRCTVPKLTNHTFAAATRLLKAAGCALGRVHRPSHRAAHPVVRHQSPAAGVRVLAGTKVALTLGPKAGRKSPGRSTHR